MLDLFFLAVLVTNPGANMKPTDEPPVLEKHSLILEAILSMPQSQLETTQQQPRRREMDLQPTHATLPIHSIIEDD